MPAFHCEVFKVRSAGSDSSMHQRAYAARWSELRRFDVGTLIAPEWACLMA